MRLSDPDQPTYRCGSLSQPDGSDPVTRDGEVIELVGPKPRPMASPRHVDCDHSGPPGLALLSVHRTSAGTISYHRCACGVWLVSQEGELRAVVAPPPPHGVIGATGDLPDD